MQNKEFKFGLCKSSDTVNTLVVMFHGYGGCGENFKYIAQQWCAKIPNIAILYPDAPFPFEGDPFNPNSKQWFSLLDRSKVHMRIGLKNVAPAVEEFIQQQLKNFQLTEKNLILSGFSQGCMLSLYISLFTKIKPLGVIGYSGVFIPFENIVPSYEGQILLVNGQNDEVITPSMHLESVSTLKNYDIITNSVIENNLEHDISNTGMMCGIEFILNLLKRN